MTKKEVAKIFEEKALPRIRREMKWLQIVTS